MSGSEIVAFIIFAYCLFVLASLGRTERRHRVPYGSFGQQALNEASRTQTRALFRAYLQQQRLAFGLFWISLVLAILFAAVLVFKLASEKRIDVEELASIGGVAGNVGLGARARWLYKNSSLRIERLLNTMLASELHIDISEDNASQSDSGSDELT